MATAERYVSKRIHDEIHSGAFQFALPPCPMAATGSNKAAVIAQAMTTSDSRRAGEVETTNRVATIASWKRGEGQFAVWTEDNDGGDQTGPFNRNQPAVAQVALRGLTRPTEHRHSAASVQTDQLLRSKAQRPSR